MSVSQNWSRRKMRVIVTTARGYTEWPDNNGYRAPILLNKLLRCFNLFIIVYHPWSLPLWILVCSLLEVMHRGALGAGGFTCLCWADRIKFPTYSCRMNEAQRFCYIFESFSVSELENLGRSSSERNDLADISAYDPTWKRKAPKHAKKWEGMIDYFWTLEFGIKLKAWLSFNLLWAHLSSLPPAGVQSRCIPYYFQCRDWAPIQQGMSACA